MTLIIPDVLTGDEVRQFRSRLDRAPWQDGADTAGSLARRVKRNQQLEDGVEPALSLGRKILRSLAGNATFISAALPGRIFPPRFNRYRGGETYGPHIDGALMQVPGTDRTLRSDLAATLFLSAPDEYDGGELTVEADAGTQQFKLQAGSMVLYPATSVHFVTPVTRGDRIGSFFWVESMVRDARQRALLYRLDRTVQALTGELGGDHEEVTNLAGLYHNLLRQWADA